MVLDHEYPDDIRVGKEIKTLTQAGHKVDLACYTLKGRVNVEQVNNHTVFRKSISVFRDKTSVGSLKFPFYFNFWKSFLNELLQKDNYDAIHIHDLPLAKVGYELSKKYNLKFVLDLHENWPVLLDLSPHTKSLLGRFLSNNKQWQEYEIKYASLADKLIVVAEEMKNRLIGKGVKNNNVYIVPNTTEIDTFYHIGNFMPDKNYVTLFYSGGINKHRGLEVVVKGLSKMSLPNNFRFWIVGSGKNEVLVKEMVKNFCLEKQVIFWGWKSQDEVFEMLLKSDITIIPHLKNEHSDNTSPNKIFHYMLAKKPMLATNCNYIQNIVEKTNSGIIYENNSPDDFVEKMNFMLKNPSKWNEWGNNGYNAVINTYSWENTSKELINVYKD